ncbi:MAG: DNA polymerase III subunit delta' [Hyphomicrobiales bacterium]|nr:DNA polymerase III subunit delta' [Hyphomicrobiales bacterium]
MATPKTDEFPRLDSLEGWPAPEAQTQWFGGAAAETTLLDAYRGGRMHHAWLIGGPKGIGKATLAYRFARFALANPDPESADMTTAADLDIAAESKTFRQVSHRAHPDLLPLERAYRTDRKRFLTELSVDQIRRTVSFFGSTSGGQGWRIAIVDPADDMNASAANALLKMLEEPPARSLFFILSHTPGRLLPTIRSRCRHLELQPLAPDAIRAAIAGHRPGGHDEADIAMAADLSDGSLRRAILLLEAGGLDVHRAFSDFASSLPDASVAAMHDLADKVARRGADDAYASFLHGARGWLNRRVRGVKEPYGQPPTSTIAAVPLARWAEVWEKIDVASAEAEALNLDRKQVALSVLMSIAHAARM